MKIGYIGLGALGGELAKRFLAEHELCVWDINTAAVQEFSKLGAQVAKTAAELAERCDVVLLCLPRSSDVRQALFGPDGLADGLSAGKLVIDQTSGVPGETRVMAMQLAEHGVAMLDAAVSASPHVVAQGTAILMVAGPDDVYERALPVLQAITQTIYRCGTRVGDGQALKMVNNAMNAGCRLATLELVAMGRKAGLSLECMTDVLNKGGARNQTTEKMLPAIVQGKSSTNFALSLMLKDVDQALMLGMDVGMPMPVTNVVRGLLQIGANTLGAKARLEDMIGLIESMAATRLASPVQSEVVQEAEPILRDGRNLRVGYVGLGAMGGALARRLMQSRTVHVYDARPEVTSQFKAEGATVAPNLPALARACDVVMLCLPTSAHVREVLFGQDGLASGLSKGSVVVDQSSGAPDETRRIAAQLRAMGVAMVDAPVTGVPQSAADGTIALMPAGDPDAYAHVKDILQSISLNTVYCGAVGNGHVVKLINNALATACRAVSYECVAAGLKYGLDLRIMVEVLNKSSGWSSALQKISSVLVSGVALSNFQIQLMVKDLKLAAGLGIAFGAPVMIASAARSLFEAGMNHLGGNASVEEMLRFYEGMSGIELNRV